jgi:hypothetical protein
LCHKSELSRESGALKAAFQFSMVQRFRKGKDLKAIDKYKPKYENSEQLAEIREKENAWLRENILTDEQKQVEMKSKVEKGRYVNALKALVREKGAKMNGDGGAIPALCNCGAMNENIKQIRSQSQGKHG